MNDWIAKLNYAAAFRTAGVRMRGLVGGHYDGQRTRGIRRLGSSSGSTRSVSTPTGEVVITSGRIDTKMAQDIMTARREIMLQKISEAEDKLGVAEKQLDVQLRNARHLQILAPIQSKSREQVVHAAGRMAAQLKWTRMEIWRLKCHKDILQMDLEEEKPRAAHSVASTEAVSPAKAADKSSLIRLDSNASTSLVPQRSPRSPDVLPSTQPASPRDEFRMDGVFQNSPEQKSSNFHKAQASWELPPLKFDSPFKHSSANSISKTLSHMSSFPNLRPTPTVETQRAVSNPQPDAVEQAVLEQSGLVESKGQPEEKLAETRSEDTKDRSEHLEKDKLDRGKIRRSLHRTLREAHVPTHNRSRKGKESSSSAGLSEEGIAEDVLSRGTGSFVVHGKKASVITFGSELQSMSPDERMRLRKQPHKDEPGFLSPATIEDDFHSVLAEPYEYHERHDSAATTSTTTARSFRELHKKLRDSSAHATVTSDGEDSEAISFSEGRRTPLPPVEDESEENSSSRPGSQSQQAMFYTPEASNSPVIDAFNEKNDPVSEHEDKDSESGMLSNSALQTVVTA